MFGFCLKTLITFGAALNGHLSTVFFKSVGLNVAADTFVQLSHMNIIGRMVVVIGDDPGANSSRKRNIRDIKVHKPDLKDALMQNIVVLAYIGKHGIIHTITTKQY